MVGVRCPAVLVLKKIGKKQVIGYGDDVADDDKDATTMKMMMAAMMVMMMTLGGLYPP